MQARSGVATTIKTLLQASVMSYGLLQAQASAQTTTVDAEPTDKNELQEVIVTASKREQNLQQVGTAVTALGAEQLAALGESDLTAITDRVPNMQFNQYSPTVTVFNIRGVSQNDYSDAQEAPIAYYNDGVYVSSMGAISGQMFDLARVEVLRGPQGTLFGRNATGGLVQSISAAPTPEFSAYLQASGGSFGEYSSEGAFSGPITDGVRARLSFFTDDDRGYVTDAPSGTRLGNTRAYGGRLQLAFDTPGDGNVLVKLWTNRNDHERPADYYTVPSYPNALGLGVIEPTTYNYWGTCPGCDILGYRSPYLNNPYVISINQLPYFTRTYYGATVTYTGNLFGQRLISISNFQGLRKDYGEDSDGTPNNLVDYFTRQWLTQESEELRLEGTGDKLQWVFGVYGLNILSNNGYEVDSSAIGSMDQYHSHTHTRSGAVFGQAEYKLSERFKFIGGLRGSYDTKDYEYNVLQLVTSVPNQYVGFNTTTYPNLAAQDYENWSGKLELDYAPSDSQLYYGTISRGTKAGGFSTPGSIPAISVQQFVDAIPYKQEVLTNYEAGLKLTMFDKSTRLNASAFHYDYHDYQAFSVIGTYTEITNNNAHVNGAEIELTNTPTKGLVLGGFASLLSSRVYNIITPSGIPEDPEMPQAPHYSLGLTLDYMLPTAVGKFTLNTDWKYNGPMYWEIFNAPADREPGEGWGDVRISLVPAAAGRWEFSVSVKNVTNKYYHIYGSDLSALGFEQLTSARPRWVLGSVRWEL
jgi:iron complex outermembrane recepter protein